MVTGSRGGVSRAAGEARRSPILGPSPQGGWGLFRVRARRRCREVRRMDAPYRLGAARATVPPTQRSRGGPLAGARLRLLVLAALLVPLTPALAAPTPE